MINLLAKLEAFVRITINRWWRPVCCAGFAGTLIVNGVVLPLITLTPANLGGMAALVGAIAAAFAVREVGKAWGTAQ